MVLINNKNKIDTFDVLFYIFLHFHIMVISPDPSTVEEWSYEHQENWPESCKEKFQSPIKLSLKDTRRKNFEKLHLNSSTYKRQNATVKNTGHSVVVRFSEDSDRLYVSGGGLKGKYIFDSFHFHWPAEHVISSIRYSLEGHFIYYSEKLKNLETAVMNKNGIAAFGVLYDVGKVDNPAFSFVNEVAAVAHKPNIPTALNTLVTLRDFLPYNLDKFYRYPGSLNTSECNESLIWTVFSVPVKFSLKQKASLTRIWNEKNERVERNCRKLQHQKGTVYFNG